ncbi:hypothetical protein [Halobacillus litoralis]|uniref:hypothetical protein n=1 Tax=Halobacillus litoralis TaxID=45668 RepID=UPI001CD607C0|nr:hypothetical protein [Halobacillus litoralis]MCA1021588.1 hypothetical protein [Halobacillus litoralis]
MEQVNDAVINRWRYDTDEEMDEHMIWMVEGRGFEVTHEESNNDGIYVTYRKEFDVNNAVG